MVAMATSCSDEGEKSSSSSLLSSLNICFGCSGSGVGSFEKRKLVLNKDYYKFTTGKEMKQEGPEGPGMLT